MEIKNGKVLFNDLLKGKLVKRYKRFLADIMLDSGELITAHCANSGSMKGCIMEGADVYVSPQNRPERKLKYTWELIKMPDSLVGVNTSIPNKLVKSAIESGKIKEFEKYTRVISEVKTSDNTRLDLMLLDDFENKWYVEIKNCTLVENKRAMFPDAVTTRGQKHLNELMDLKEKGYNSAVFFLVQRMDSDFFSPADHIDSEYGKLLRKAFEKGVDIIVYDTNVTKNSIEIRENIKVVL
ncbi:MAG: DNA/RNA nuclease SfsA [Desulfobacteraceae bacterium]|nr:DNA/RNA nuclease SfsA [Desulfobacteraceae bacterium]